MFLEKFENRVAIAKFTSNKTAIVIANWDKTPTCQ